MNKIHTENAPAAIGPYSQGYEVNGVVYTSGQLPVDPQTGAAPEGITAQAEQSCKNVGAILEAGGSGFEQVFKTLCFFAFKGYRAKSPSRKISTSWPSSVVPTIFMSGVPIMKSMWMVESLNRSGLPAGEELSPRPSARWQLAFSSMRVV